MPRLRHGSSRARLLAPVVLLLAALVVPAGAAVAASSGGAKKPATAPTATKRPPAKKRPPPPPVRLVWHAEMLEGGLELASHRADDPINPASVVKVATTLWALEELGPEHRFDTVVLARGPVFPDRGVLDGDLIVLGSGDPDFHVENAFLVAARLNQIGIQEVRGSLRVNETFWIGWEGGAERRLSDPAARARQMAQRLRATLDPARWTPQTRASWREMAERYALPVSAPPKVVVRAGADLAGERSPDDHVLLTHRSKSLADALRRFDCYSNNDIERLEASLGSPAELARRLAESWEVPPEKVRLDTTSGLGTNRMTPRQIVRLLRDLREASERKGVSVESLLPVAGCDPGTLNYSFASLGRGPHAMSVVAKTGTLTSTDGGIAVLAGFASTARGEIVFCVAAPGGGTRLAEARRAELRWLEDLLAALDGGRARECAPPMGFVEEGAEILPSLPSLGEQADVHASPANGRQNPPEARGR